MNHRTPPSPWIAVTTPRPAARTRLLCLPYAGGGTAIFRGWGALLPSDIEVGAVRMPGREGRFSEPAPRRMEELLPGLVSGLAEELTRPFSLFGHSLGAVVAFEVCRELRRRGMPQPEHLFVSGRRAPHLAEAGQPGRPPVHELSDAELLRELARMGSAAAGGAANAGMSELWELMLPTLRADFELGARRVHRDEAPLSCPITAFCGRDDEDTPEPSVAAWGAHTTGRFALHLLDGDHFFVHPRAAAILEVIGGALAPSSAGRAAAADVARASAGAPGRAS